MKMRNSLLIVLVVLLGACAQQPANYSKMKRENFQAEVDGKQTDLFTLKNKNGVEITVTNFGGRVVEFFAPDRNGEFVDIVLGHDHIDKYVNYVGERFLGATIGRFGNRIANGKFAIDGTEYQLAINNGPNCLHGGLKSFDMVVWDAVQVSPQLLELSYLSPDGEEGFPGNLTVKMTYELTDDNQFIVTHHATTDKKTVINLTHHSFFNLHGAGNGTINDHVLMLNADRLVAVNDVLIPTGELMPVEGTPMDFQQPTEIGSRVNEEFEQLKFGNGYDHCWVLKRTSANETELAASVYEPQSGRFLEVFTSEPGIQFYGGNFFDGSTVGKENKPYNFRESFALETQHFPDSPNQPTFPTTLLEPGQEYKHVCIYKIGVK